MHDSVARPALTLPELITLGQRAARGKRRARSVATFLCEGDQRLIELLHALWDRSYRPGRGRSFWIQDPKPRKIYALPFRDRVVQHYLIDRTLPAIEAALAPQSYACRVGYGSHRALRRASDLMRTHRYAARIDIRKFFPSIDHALLRRRLLRVTPPPLRWLMDRFLDSPIEGEVVHFHFPGDLLLTPFLRPHGLPIGSLTSQIWANVYLSPIDHALGSYLRLPRFVRYCDDLLVFSDDPGRLRAALQSVAAQAEGLRLRLHPIKTRLHRTSDPVPFLGFVLQRRGDGVRVRLRAGNVVRMRRRLATARRLFSAGALSPEEITARVRSWLAHARHGQTRALIEAELARLRFQLREEDE